MASLFPNSPGHSDLNVVGLYGLITLTHDATGEKFNLSFGASQNLKYINGALLWRGFHLCAV